MFICKTPHGCAVTDYDKFELMYSVRKFLATLFSFSAFSGSEALIALCIKSLIFDLFFLIFSILYVIILVMIIHFDLER